MKIALIDNYDSFTYNLSHLIKELGAEVTVMKNDRFDIEDLEAYDKILLSPGPGIPQEAGLLMEVINKFSGKKPILGICLGEQAIGEAFGGKIYNLENVYHGIQSKVRIMSDDYLFDSLPTHILVGRYHSWVVDKESLPPCLTITAESEDGHIMAIKHNSMDVRGIQFHPESVLTPCGKKIIENWLKESHSISK